MTAKSYARIKGANDRLAFAICGVHSRGQSHVKALAECDNVVVSHICEVDHDFVESFSAKTAELFGQRPELVTDIRKLVEIKNLDAITIAAPDHWHATMAVMGVQNGKHVYVEKPCSHNPRESEILVEAQKKRQPFIQMGTQQRSAPHTIYIINKIKEGLIGRVYYAKAWYYNARGPIGVGKIVPPPASLDWELWQGPAPRGPYKDNLHPYNWHWFWRYGTGEALNNGTHELDVCRWALGVDFPKRVSASGGRYHYHDDWEFYDTLVTGFDYDDKTIVWEGLSCQGKKSPSRGSLIHGTEGAVFIDRKGYTQYDRSFKVVDEVTSEGEKPHDPKGLMSGPDMTTRHFQNFIDAIRSGRRAKLNSPIEDASISVTTLHLSNIAWKMGRSLDIDSASGRILHDEEAMKMWGRQYEKGWELKA